jgi:hypothetical protein
LRRRLAPEGAPRVKVRTRVPDRRLSTDVASKSLRKALRAIRDAGADNVALVLQGWCLVGDTIAEAALSAQPRAAKPPQVHDPPASQ